MQGNKIALIAFGGNALLKETERGTQGEQLKNAEKACRVLMQIIKRGYKLVIVHGNGPQVGNILIQMEEAVTKIPPFSLDTCVAMSQGSMGYMLERAMRNQLRKEKQSYEVLTVITEVSVDEKDEAFKKPTKPVGPFFTRYRSSMLQKEKKWVMVEDSGRGYRRVVPSPRPVEIVNLDAIIKLIDQDFLVIACGGGGIPVFKNAQGLYEGIEAVIDKDYTSALLASAINAELFIILTNVERVALNYGKPDQQWLNVVTVDEMKTYYKEKHFPAGSMGPKVEAAIAYIERGGKEAIITSADKLKEALDGTSGTRILSLNAVVS
ncbi:MAG: carbamate kinase [Candidatus Fischerbacteria bacterium RBG_13_37_8]|uniref:Carbamate kinase n=1 Tax=Candidatus Fischerbacteria bacterium RBG_13_37_8 TaxID=1817863 RepID=A0A1F5V667_9BACT|nr:MAG: carbamate kinase [Candidatus Fischerbacteria bacterium RBG_13_37_8]